MGITYTDLHTKYDLNIFKCRDVKTPENEDVKTTENPKTYDGIGSYVIFGSLALVLLAVIGVFSKKKLFN